MHALFFLLSAASYLSQMTLVALSATALLAKQRREPLAPVIDVIAYIVAGLSLIFGVRLMLSLRVIHHAGPLFPLAFFLLRFAAAQLLWFPAIRRNSCATLAISLLLLISTTVSWILFRMHH